MTDRTDTAGPRAESQDILHFLRTEHRELRTLVGALRVERGPSRNAIVDRLRDAHDLYRGVEEEIVYPAYLEATHARSAEVDVTESVDEHRIIDETLHAMTGLDPESVAFDAKLKLLDEQVTHHMDEAERNLFPELEREVAEPARRELAQRARELRGDRAQSHLGFTM